MLVRMRYKVTTQCVIIMEVSNDTQSTSSRRAVCTRKAPSPEKGLRLQKNHIKGTASNYHKVVVEIVKAKKPNKSKA